MNTEAIIKSTCSLIVVALAIGGCTGGNSSAAGASGGTATLSASIFTTDAICDGTEIAQFAGKGDVYVDGTGSPGSTFFVQVTEPAPHFTVLGTSVTVNELLGPRPILVGGDGRFDGCFHLADIVRSSSSSGDGRANGYDDTGNSGGVYKVWISLDPTFPIGDSVKFNFKI